MSEKTLTPDYLFEVSWEICNKVGGINTVIATKASILHERLKDNFILIGPDLWRETGKNPVFIEDYNLMNLWKAKAAEEGVRLRIGRWDIVSKPLTILIDFTAFISRKDKIFASYWETFKLDSISGGMDYIESAIFGYTAAKVIESFYRYNLTGEENVVAHFHEWMTGAGILELHERMPQIGTLFTTHATVVGRSIAGNGQELYKKLDKYNGDSKAKELGVVAKQSLEKVSANTVDCFTTVSDITSKECQQFLERKVDVVTPNGFEDNFVPKDGEYEHKRNVARKRLLEVAGVILGYEVPTDSLLIANSGRYEFRNKGIDVFINSMDQLNKRDVCKKTIIAFILVPANNYGPRKEVIDKLNNKNNKQPLKTSYLTHGLHESDYDLILNEIKSTGLRNEQTDKVKIIYAPCYLDGNDGIFNLKYYDLLIGMDLTIFPSYYEPWGYTPLESLAFSIPTITTNLAGIGMWVNSELVEVNNGIDVFGREVGIDQKLVKQIVERIENCCDRTVYDRQRARENAFSISRIALWKNLIKYYFDAYNVALGKVEQRSDKFVQIAPPAHVIPIKPKKVNQPVWREVIVESNIPEQFKGLIEISQNIWWTWHYSANELFENIDKKIWEETNHNPILLLKEVSYDRFKELEDDRAFIYEYDSVYSQFKKYISEKPKEGTPKIAYFSMEFGLCDLIKIYSGGLGILAGDYLKEASDSNVDMIGIGLLYRYGYFTQHLSIGGEQMVTYEPQNFVNLPIHQVLDANGDLKVIQVAFPGRIIYARIWRVDVGRIPLYLLDTDFGMNNDEDRRLSHQLYGGNNEHRLKQEMLLGIGGIRAINEIKLDVDLFHCNEGHAAFISLERLRELIVENNFTFAESLEIVRASSLFTTHTPVPAGHDAFPEDLIMVYMGHYPDRFKISWEEFIGLGRLNPEDRHEKFSMSHLAINTSQEVNGVSMLHGDVTKNMFARLWEGYFPEELHISYVTNGVHMQSWVAKDWKVLYKREFGKDFIKDQSNSDHWDNIYKVPDKEIWNIRQAQRARLITYIKDRLSANWIKRNINPKTMVKVKDHLKENVLTIGFARRFATYKRAHLLMEDIDRLSSIINNPKMPVQFLFAGKAHPADGAGQGLIKKIVEISNRPEFMGKILFLQNYDIELAKLLVQGVDIWLNTPTRPLEASGTSGMKAVMNGVMNFSVLDGWWVEGYANDAGWKLSQEKTYQNQEFQDDLDAETIYSKLEQKIMPLFYSREDGEIPVDWIRYIKNCIAKIAPNFTTKRMIDDYFERFYNKLFARTVKMRENDFKMAKDLAKWKKRIALNWNNIKVVDINFLTDTSIELTVGKQYTGKLVLDLGIIPPTSVGVEVVITEKMPDGKMNIHRIDEMKLVDTKGSRVTYMLEISPVKSGVYNYSMRLFPKNPDLPHRQDFSYLTWIS